MKPASLATSAAYDESTTVTELANKALEKLYIRKGEDDVDKEDLLEAERLAEKECDHALKKQTE